MSPEKKTKKPASVQKKSAGSKPMPPLAMYRHIAISFVVIVVAILAIVLYMSTVQATIRVMPVERQISTDFVLDIVKTPTRDNEIRGRVVSLKIGKKESAVPSGEGIKEIEGQAKGNVIILNSTNKDQPLIKTTRLLTPDGVLFRVDSNVTVPAKGQVEVGVYADVSGATGDVGPTKFTIPGLSASLQEVIYAQSSEPFSGGITTVNVISTEDIDSAKLGLKEKLKDEAKKILREEVGNLFAGETFYVEVLDESSSVQAGEEASEFEVNMTVDVIGVFYDQTALKELAELQLYSQLQQGFAFSDIKTDELEATVEKYNTDEEQANVRVTFSGTSVPSLTHPDLDPANFIGMNKDDVKKFFVGKEIVKEVDVMFFPFWNKSVPSLKDHIFVEIK
ncbi:MAG: hypothetical protein ABIH21_00960 [Patescibacteria group bacterium]